MIKWSASRINTANYCRMRYWLKYVDPSKPKSLRLSAYVKGSLLHDLAQNFWKKLGTPEEVKSTSKKFKDKKYYDAESFSKYAQGKWTSIIFADEKSSEKIFWKDKNEKWVTRTNLPKICTPFYDFLIKEGPPLFAELAINASLDGRVYYGRIDEIRKSEGKIIIRDWKSGSPWMGEMKLKHDPQLTFYNFLLCSLANKDREFADKLGLEEKIVESYLGNPLYVDPNIELQFAMIESLAIDLSDSKIKNAPQFIQSTYRTNENFFELVKMVDGMDRAIETGDIYPERGKKCDICDMKEACDKKLYDVDSGKFVGKNGQILLDFFTPHFLRKEEKNSKGIFMNGANRAFSEEGEDLMEKNKTQKKFSFRYNLKIGTEEA